MTPAITPEAALSAAFLEELIKRSVDAEVVLFECGRLRLQRACKAAVELFVEQQAVAAQRPGLIARLKQLCPPGGQKEAQ